MASTSVQQEQQKECGSEKKTLVLIGGGHAHVQVITDPRFRDSQNKNVRRILLNDSRTAVYSGLVPAVIAKLTPVGSSEIDLEKLCNHYGVHFIHGVAISIDARARQLTFQPRHEGIKDEDESKIITQSLRYSLLSINVGSVTRPVKGMKLFEKDVVIATRPIARLVRSLECVENAGNFRILIVGAGHAGIELALAIHARFGSARVTIAGKGFEKTTEMRNEAKMRNGWTKNNKALEVAAAKMRKAGITFMEDYIVNELRPPSSACATKMNEYGKAAESHEIGFDVAILATGAAPPPLLTKTDLPLNEDGWMTVNGCLQSLHSDGTIFAAGDCISIKPSSGTGVIPLPKAGVFAVRQGVVLSYNLWVALGMNDSDGKFREYVPQKNFLSLISTGDGGAVGTKYGIAFSGTWVFRLKMFIDEAWQDRFRMSGKPKSELDSVSFEGTPLEAAATLIAADDIRVDDHFGMQWAVLKRMDVDQTFRKAVIDLILGKDNI